MKHPFEVILPNPAAGSDETTTRRRMIRQTVTAGATVIGLSAITEAASDADGGSSSNPPKDNTPKPQPPKPSTRRLGEEGGPRATTGAVGEEGGRITTQAIGEEGGRVTTKAVGEEGGRRPAPPKFEALKKEFDAQMTKDELLHANTTLTQMVHHPEKAKHAKPIADAKAALNKKALSVLDEAKAAVKKEDILTAVEKVRIVERLYTVDARKQAVTYHKKLREKKGYKAAWREASARQIYASVAKAKKPADKQRLLQIIVRSYGDTETGKKAADELKKMPPVKPAPGRPPGRITTLAVGEEG